MMFPESQSGLAAGRSPEDLNFFDMQNVRLCLAALKKQMNLVDIDIEGETCGKGDWLLQVKDHLRDEIAICEETLAAEKDLYWRFLRFYPTRTPVILLRGKSKWKTGTILCPAPPAPLSSYRRFCIQLDNIGLDRSREIRVNEDGFSVADRVSNVCTPYLLYPESASNIEKLSIYGKYREIATDSEENRRFLPQMSRK